VNFWAHTAVLRKCGLHSRFSDPNNSRDSRLVSCEVIVSFCPDGANLLHNFEGVVDFGGDRLTVRHFDRAEVGISGVSSGQYTGL